MGRVRRPLSLQCFTPLTLSVIQARNPAVPSGKRHGRGERAQRNKVHFAVLDETNEAFRFLQTSALAAVHHLRT